MGAIRTNRQLLSRGTDVYAKKKSAKSAGVEKIDYDSEARKEFLTGFHKRKVERKEKAKEVAAKRARQARIEERKKLREERKAKLEEDLKNYRLAYHSSGLLDLGDTKDKKKKDEDEENGQETAEHGDDSDYSDWDGIGEKNEEKSVSGILKKRQVYEGDGSEDESATVVIEEMTEDNTISSKSGDNYVYPEMSKQVLQASIQKAKAAALQASIYGFPEPSIYRDEDDPLGLNDEDSDDDQASKKKVEIDVNKEFKNKRQPREDKRKKNKSTRYLTKSERLQNARREKNRNKEKRQRAKNRK